MHNQIATRPIMDIVIGGFVFCIGGLLVKYLAMSGVAVAFWRMVVASFLLTALILPAKHAYLSRREQIFGALSGVFLALDLILWHESIYAIGPGIATVLNSVQIFFGAFLGLWLFKETVSVKMLGCFFVAIIGISLISTGEIHVSLPKENQNTSLYGILTGVISALFYALALISLKPLNKTAKTHKAPLQFAQTPPKSISLPRDKFVKLVKIMRVGALSGAVTCGIVAFIFHQSLSIPDLNSAITLIFYAAITHVLGWALLTRALPLLPIAISGLILMTEPIITVLLDMAIYNKSISSSQWLGIMITLSSVYVGTLRRSEKS